MPGDAPSSNGCDDVPADAAIPGSASDGSEKSGGGGAAQTAIGDGWLAGCDVSHVRCDMTEPLSTKVRRRALAFCTRIVGPPDPQSDEFLHLLSPTVS